MQPDQQLTIFSAVNASTWRSAAILKICSALLIAAGLASPAEAALFSITNLVTDDQTVNSAKITDLNLINAWGVSRSAASPFWVSNNGTGTATLYSVNPTTDATTKQALTVSIPGAGNVTGQAFANVAGSFNGDTFLFVSEDGTVSGWRNALGTTAETLVLASSNAVYKGSAFATIAGNGYLYAANFLAGQVDVFKGNGGAPNLVGTFTDPTLPSGYAPFNVENLGGKIYVTYAKRSTGSPDEITGSGFGFVSAFDLQGNFLGRIASEGTLNAPWGLELAPASFGDLAGDLLVGNFGNGMISAFNLATSSFAGQLLCLNGQPIVIDGLWDLIAGNGGSGGSTQAIYFSAGPVDESHGLFGVIRVAQSVPEPATLGLLVIGLAGLGASRRRKQ